MDVDNERKAELESGRCCSRVPYSHNRELSVLFIYSALCVSTDYKNARGHIMYVARGVYSASILLVSTEAILLLRSIKIEWTY